jgi:hypothetical protein
MLFLVALTLLGSQQVMAQEFPDLDKSPMDMAYFPARAPFRSFEKDDAQKQALAPVARVIYSRPQMKGRTVFGDMVKYGEIWRVGANEASELLVLKTMDLGGTTVKPGRYSLHLLPTADSWTLILNSDLDSWGSYAYNEANDVARIEAEVKPTSDPVEALSIMFSEDALIIAWENSMISVPIKG